MDIVDGQIIETKTDGKRICLDSQLHIYDETRCYLPYHKYAPGFLVNIYNSYVAVYYYEKGDLTSRSSYPNLAFYLVNYKCLYKTKKNDEKMLFLVHHCRNQYYFISDRVLYFETPEKDIITEFDGKNAKGTKYTYVFTDTIKFLKNNYYYYYCPNIKEVANSVKQWRKNPHRYENACTVA